uniref:Putative ovule protein n=1 Tax=Solanum chacoense TaxID=4108 RepID=A0A0V0HQG1_SOLCH
MTGMRWIRSESRSVGGMWHDKEREDYQSDSSDGLGMRKENKSGIEEENNGDVREGKGKYMQKKGENGVHCGNESVANNGKDYENLGIIIRDGDEYGKDMEAEELDEEGLTLLEKRRKHEATKQINSF